MKSRITIIILTVSSITIFLASLYFYQLKQTEIKELQDENNALLEKITTLEQRDIDANIVKRTSAQLEEIAFQQKTISDIQREEALSLKKEADRQKDFAIKEKFKASQAEKAAVEAFQGMEVQKHIADTRRIEAERAKRKTDSLARLTLGVSLATQAQDYNTLGQTELANLLAKSAYLFIKENKGNIYSTRLYNSLTSISNMSSTNTIHKGIITHILNINNSKKNKSFCFSK